LFKLKSKSNFNFFPTFLTCIKSGAIHNSYNTNNSFNNFNSNSNQNTPSSNSKVHFSTAKNEPTFSTAFLLFPLALTDALMFAPEDYDNFELTLKDRDVFIRAVSRRFCLLLGYGPFQLSLTKLDAAFKQEMVTLPDSQVVHFRREVAQSTYSMSEYILSGKKFTHTSRGECYSSNGALYANHVRPIIQNLFKQWNEVRT
jgi:hypothetical protein